MRWSPRHILVAVAATFSLPPAQAADPQPYDVEIVSSGNRTLDDILKQTSQLVALRTSAPVGPFGLVTRARSDLPRLGTVLNSFGYYQGSASIRINDLPLSDAQLPAALAALPAGTEAHCRIAVTLGPLYHLGQIEVEGTLPPGARDALGLSPGAPAIAADVLAAAARLLAALQDQGFAFARVDPPIAYEDPDQRLLDISYHVDTGPSVRIGVVRVTGLHKVHGSALRWRLQLHQGDLYSAKKVEQVRKELLDLGVFSAVNVRLGTPAESAQGLPVTFQVQERPRRAVGITAAYSSDLGGSGGLTWTNRNLLGNADQLTLTANVLNLGGTATNTVGYELSAKYLLADVGRAHQSVQFALSAIRQSLDAYDQTAQTAAVTARRKLSSVWSVGTGISIEDDLVTQEGETHDYSLLAVTLSGYYDSTNLANPLDDPRHGMRFTLSIAPTLSRGIPDSTFMIVQATLAMYLDLQALTGGEAGRSVLAMRALSGVAKGASGLDLPPDERFYAGGSGTIRGYRYQSVGPQFPDGKPVGGNAVAAASVELRQRIGANLGAAVFVDAGQVSGGTDPASGDTRVGVGAGMRYYTPIGPVRFDLALPVRRRSGDDKFEVYIGLGQAF